MVSLGASKGVYRCFNVRGGLRGGEGDARPFPQELDPLPTQIFPPLYCCEISIFDWRTLNFFQGSYLRRQFILILRVERLKNTFLVPIFQNTCGAEILAKTGSFFLFWESSENQFGRPKKRSPNFSIFFLKIPLQKPLHPPLFYAPFNFVIFFFPLNLSFKAYLGQFCLIFSPTLI